MEKYFKSNCGLFTSYMSTIGSFIFPGQPPVFTSTTNNDSKKTKTLLVKNVPATADEDLLEMFFETTKKQGGGPVKSVKILRDKNVAFVEFCDRSSVEKVMNKRPIKLGTTVLDIQPYEPLLEGSEKINRMDVIGLPASFTDGLLKRQLETLLSPQGGTPTPSAEPKCETLTKTMGSHTPPAPTQNLTARTQRKSEKNAKKVRNLSCPVHVVPCDENGKMITEGSRVVRGKHWHDGNGDGGGEGTVTGLYSGGVNVRWDNGNVGRYYLGQKHLVKVAE